MGYSNRLGRHFFNRPTLQVARELLGAKLVHLENRQRIAGLIIETEAYCGESDLACHAKAGRTARTEIMYGPPGFAYVYLNYGVHWLFNLVTCPVDHPEAVLIRALIPTEGIPTIQDRRGKQLKKDWTNGPGKLTQALGITQAANKQDICHPGAEFFIEEGLKIPEKHVTTNPRVGLYSVPEPWKGKPWRFNATLPPDFVLY